ncbi:MAG: hypothetical protein NVS3B14_17160 [Ktedonobacteraceae bacterium]
MATGKDTSSAETGFRLRPPQVDRYIDRFLDAACDPSRRSILELLVPPEGQDSPDGYELRAGEIAHQLGLAPSTTSEHLRQLLDLHLLSARKEGTMVYYRLRNRHLVRAFHEMLRAIEIHYSTHGSPPESSGQAKD